MPVQATSEIRLSSGRLDFYEGKQVVVAAGLESDREGKEVYNDQEGGKHACYTSHPPAVGQDPPVVVVADSRSRKKWFFMIVAGILIIVVAISIAVALVVSRNKNNSAPNPAAPSIVTSKSSGGVLKGTRLTMMNPQTGGDIYLFYQRDDGGLRYVSESPEHIWQGSSELHVTDAKLGTPLTSISTESNGSTYWWLFYVDTANVIRNIYSTNDPTTWREGNVGSKGYKVPKETNIAFTAGGGITYNHTLNEIDGGISLYASGTDGTIHEYIFDNQNGTWDNGFTFPDTDGFSGAAIWSTSSNATLYTASSSQSLELWFRDYNDTSSGNGNRWQLGPSSRADLMQNGSMCGQWGIAFQSAGGIVQGSNFTAYGDSGHTRWDTTYNISDQAAINGSAVSCWYYFPAKAPSRDMKFQIFYQTDERKIEQAVRMWGPDNHTVPGIWNYDSVPV